MYEGDYGKIVQAHAEGDLSLQFLGRRPMAVPPSFSKMDVVVKAVVL